MKHIVTIRRTELITFEVEAASQEEAASTFLMEGDEVFSVVTENEVLLITTVEDSDQ